MATKSAAEIRKLNKDKLLEYALELTENFKVIAQKCEDFGKRITALEASSTTPSTSPKQLDRLVAAERDNLNNGQYLRRRQLEIWNLSSDSTDASDLKKEAAELLSLTGVAVAAADIDVCHKLKKEGKIIMEFRHRDQRDRVVRARKHLKNMKHELEKKKCPKISVVESMCPEYKRLDYICRQLKNRGKVENTWFFNRKLYIADAEGSKSLITHINDLTNKFDVNIVQEILEN